MKPNRPIPLDFELIDWDAVFAEFDFTVDWDATVADWKFDFEFEPIDWDAVFADWESRWTSGKER